MLKSNLKSAASNIKDETLIDYARNAEITRAQRLKLIKAGLAEHMHEVRKTGSNGCRHMAKSITRKLVSHTSHKVSKLAQKLEQLSPEV